MKIGELFVNITTKADLKGLEKAHKEMEKAERETRRLIQLEKDLAKATTEEQKELIRKNSEQKKELAILKDAINEKREHQKAILGVVKGIGAMITSVTIAYKVLDKMVDSLQELTNK